MAESYDYLFKVLMIGDSSVGKSSILLRYTDNEFQEDHPCTIGVDFKSKRMKIRGKAISLSIWDTAGQEKFRSVTASYYRNTQGIVLTYDVTNEESFKSIATWLNEAQMYCTYDDVVKLLVGNKIDKSEDRVIAKDAGVEFAKKHGMMYLECSAKTNTGIKEVFDELAFKIMERPQLLQSAVSSSSAAATPQLSGNSGANDGYCGC